MSKLLTLLIFLGIIPIIYAQTITDVIPLEAAKEIEEEEGSNPDQMSMKSSDAAKNINLSDFALPRVKNNKEMVQLGKFKGKPLFVTFFSVGCGFCQTMMDDLKCVKEKLPGKVNAIAVGLDSPGKAMKKYIKKQELTFDALIGNKEFEKRVGGVDATPYTFVLDPNSNVIGKTYGTMDCTDIVAFLKKLGYDK